MKFDKTRLYAPALIFGALALLLIVGLYNGNPASRFTRHVGDAAPVTDLPVLNEEGSHFKTSAWRGRPYIVNFFASWCGDCHLEHEELMTLSAGNIPVIGIIFKDKSDKAAAWLDREGNPYLAVARDDDGQAGVHWGVAGVPESFIVDAQGIIRWHHSGGLTDKIVSDELMPIWESVRLK